MKATSSVIGLSLMMLLAVAITGCGAAATPSKPSVAPGTAGEIIAPRPDVIELPNGFAPEGITSWGDEIFVGSIPTGAVFKASVLSGEGTLVVPAQPGRASLGLKIDDRQRLFVAGGATGKAFVYDAETGAPLADYVLSTGKPAFINDVTLTPDAAWFTDSKSASLYRLNIPSGPLGGQDAVAALRLTGDFTPATGADAFNLNGIVWTGSRLISVQSATGTLFSIDPTTGMATKIDLAGENVEQGDGMWLDGKTLYVVQNRLNRIAVIAMADDMLSGKVTSRISNSAFDVPTTITATGTSLYLPNARFGTQVTPETTYTVVRVAKP